MKIDGNLQVLAVGAVAVFIGAWYLQTKLSNAAGAVADAAVAAAPYINPADGRNVVNQGVSAIGGAISGSEDWSLGSWLYDVTH